MINLLAKLGLDIGPFRRGLGQAETLARGAGPRMARHFGESLKESMKFAALLAGGGAALNRFTGAQEARDRAAAAGTTIQQAVAMERVVARLGDTSNVSADELKRLADEEIANGFVAAEEDLKALAEAADQFGQGITRAAVALDGLLSHLGKVRIMGSYLQALVDALKAFATTEVDTSGPGGGFSGLAQAGRAAGKAFKNRLELDRQIMTAEDADPASAALALRARRTPKDPEKEPTKREVDAYRYSPARVVTPETPVGGLAKAGLLFGFDRGGSPILREAQRQTALSQAQLAQLMRIEASINREL